MNDGNSTTNHQDLLTELDPIQYRDIYHEDDVPLSNVRESASRYLLYGGLVILLLFIFAGAITPISRTIKTRFTVENAIPEQSVRFFDDVYLLHSFVKPGQRVQTGAPLVRFNSAQISSLLAAFQQAEQELLRFKQFQTPLQAAELRSLELRRERQNAEAEQTRKLRLESESIYQAEREKQRLILINLHDQQTRQQELFAKALIAEENYAKAANDFNKARQDSIILERNHRKQAAELDKTLAMLQYDMKILEQTLSEKQSQHANEASRLEQKKTQSWENIRQLYGNVEIQNGGLILRTEFPGSLSYLIDQHEGTVPRQTTILRVQPETSQYRLVASIQAKEVAHVNKNTPLKLQFDAYPQTQWGYLNGKVIFINTTPDQQGAYPFEGEIFNDPNSKIHLQTSLTGTCFIRVQEGAFFSYIFDRAKRALIETLN